MIATLAALAILIPLAIPLLSLTLGQKDVAALSTSTTARRAYDLISDNFGPGVNGPLLVAVSLGSPAQASSSSGSASSSRARSGSDPRASDPRLQTLEKDVSQTPGVAAVTPVQIDKAGTTAYFNAIATTGPAEQATTDLVSKLRSSVIPDGREGHQHDRLRGRHHRQQRGPRLGHLQQAAAADPGRDRAQLPAADARVPHAS